MFWALFVLGHDWYDKVQFFFLNLFFQGFKKFLVNWEISFLCSGHGSFSNDAKLNSVVGHFLHSSILVPYHGWYFLRS